MKRSAFLIVFLALAVFPAALSFAQEDEFDEFPCEGMLERPEELAGILAQVGKYQATYVLVFLDELSDQVVGLDAPALKELSFGVYGESPAEAMAAPFALSGVEPYSFDAANAAQIVDDILAGDLQVGLLWAPLAGLAALELDFNYELSLRTAGPPEPSPAMFAAPAAAEASACAQEIESQLGGYGVVPAEKLVKIDIRSLLHLQPPPRQVEAAQQGAGLYAEHCAKCHGPNGVAATDALAPVDLLISTPRFSYPGFLYIVWNGRSQNGMPGFRGTLEQNEVELIYQFARERSYGWAGQDAP